MAKDRTKDLTQGTPWKVIAGFSLPVIGGNLFQLFYTLADSMIVGRTLGADALAAVGALMGAWLLPNTESATPDP